ncbi:MAG: fused MFS/spermidine synthase [Candidatus Omnitrophota bacterium]
MRLKYNFVLYLCFFLSGVAGLIYEIVWAKYLTLILGNTAYAHTLVLATFMTGLTLGSFLLGKFADRVKNRLSFFAWVEIGIALFCVFTPNLFVFSRNIYLAAAKNLSQFPVLIVITKFIISALIMLPPTILMGGTLPILSRFMIKALSVRGKIVARLYYLNSFGAVAGTIWAGFYLIYSFGLEFSIFIAVFINFFVGGAAIILNLLYRNISKKPRPFEKTPPQELSSVYQYVFTDKTVNIAKTGIFVSGFAAMLYEIVWIRLLSLILGSSTYSFSLMLAAFISGITLGSFLISRLMPKEKFTFFVFGICEILIGISLICTLPFYEKLPFIFSKLAAIFVRTPQTFPLYAGLKFLLSFTVMFIPTMFMGMTLPLVSKIASSKLQTLGKNIGSVFAANTSGNIAGAFATGLFIIPLIGLKYTLELGIIINLLLGMIVLFLDNSFKLKQKLICSFLVVCIFTSYKILVPDWNMAYFSTQAFRYPRNIKETFNDFSQEIKENNILFYQDGLNASVAVMHVVSASREERILFINGKPDASTGADMPTQILSAHLPLLLKPAAKDVLVVGLGSGVTCGSALLHPIKNLDLIEISRTVVEANKCFSSYNYNALRDARLNLHLEDAKTFLLRTDKKYDVIISEPSNPWISGIGALFSQEFYQECYNHLNKRGIMLQWVQTYEMNNETFALILQTFFSVFPHVSLWTTGIYDIFIIGSREEFTPDFIEMEKRLAEENITHDLFRIKVNDIFTLLSLQLSSSKSIAKLIPKNAAAVNSDYFPSLDYQAPLGLYTKISVSEKFIKMFDERKLPLENSVLLIKNYLGSAQINYNNLKNLYTYLHENPAYNNHFLISLVKKWHTKYPEDEQAALAFCSYNIEGLETSIRILKKLIFTDKKIEHIEQYAALAMNRYHTLQSFLLPEVFTETVENIKTCVDLSLDKKARFYYFLGKIYLSINDDKNALNFFNQAEKLITTKNAAKAQGINYEKFLADIAVTQLNCGNKAKARAYAKKILQRNKNHPRAAYIIEISGD